MTLIQVQVARGTLCLVLCPHLLIDSRVLYPVYINEYTVCTCILKIFLKPNIWLHVLEIVAPPLIKPDGKYLAGNQGEKHFTCNFMPVYTLP